MIRVLHLFCTRCSVYLNFISLFQLMVPVMESNAMLMPLVLNRRMKSLVSVYAKVAGRATEGLVKVRRKGNHLRYNSLVFTLSLLNHS